MEVLQKKLKIELLDNPAITPVSIFYIMIKENNCAFMFTTTLFIINWN